MLVSTFYVIQSVPFQLGYIYTYNFSYNFFCCSLGILQREQEQSVVYGSVDSGKSISSHDKFLELVIKKILEYSLQQNQLHFHGCLSTFSNTSLLVVHKSKICCKKESMIIMIWFLRDKDLNLLQHLRYIEFHLICLRCIFFNFVPFFCESVSHITSAF